MSKEECYKFIVKCLGEAPPRAYDDRVVTVFREYDDDKDEYLTFQNFLDFY